VDSYFRYGALEVWQACIMYASAREIRKLSTGNSVTTALLPRFELPVATFFRP
jgi:hypothetical protein